MYKILLDTLETMRGFVISESFGSLIHLPLLKRGIMNSSNQNASKTSYIIPCTSYLTKNKRKHKIYN